MPFAARKRSFRFINRRKNFQTSPLAFFPQGQRFLHRVFLTAKPAHFDCLADERLLVWGQMYFHTLRVRVKKAGVKHGFPTRCTAIYGSDWITVFTRFGSSNVVRSPGFAPATGRRRALSGFDNLADSVATSPMMRAS